MKTENLMQSSDIYAITPHNGNIIKDVRWGVEDGRYFVAGRAIDDYEDKIYFEPTAASFESKFKSMHVGNQFCSTEMSIKLVRDHKESHMKGHFAIVLIPPQSDVNLYSNAWIFVLVNGLYVYLSPDESNVFREYFAQGFTIPFSHTIMSNP